VWRGRWELVSGGGAAKYATVQLSVCKSSVPSSLEVEVYPVLENGGDFGFTYNSASDEEEDDEDAAVTASEHLLRSLGLLKVSGKNYLPLRALYKGGEEVYDASQPEYEPGTEYAQGTRVNYGKKTYTINEPVPAIIEDDPPRPSMWSDVNASPVIAKRGDERFDDTTGLPLYVLGIQDRIDTITSNAEYDMSVPTLFGKVKYQYVDGTNCEAGYPPQLKIGGLYSFDYKTTPDTKFAALDYDLAVFDAVEGYHPATGDVVEFTDSLISFSNEAEESSEAEESEETNTDIKKQPIAVCQISAPKDIFSVYLLALGEKVKDEDSEETNTSGGGTGSGTGTADKNNETTVTKYKQYEVSEEDNTAKFTDTTDAPNWKKKSKWHLAEAEFPIPQQTFICLSCASELSFITAYRVTSKGNYVVLIDCDDIPYGRMLPSIREGCLVGDSCQAAENVPISYSIAVISGWLRFIPGTKTQNCYPYTTDNPTVQYG
jgi:hypothetical protein